MTIKTGVEFGGDASGAKRAGKQAEGALAGVGREAKGMAGEIVKGGLALAGMAGAVDIVRKGVMAANAAVSDYIARNTELSGILADGRAEVLGHVDALLEQEVTAGAVTEVMGTLSEAVRIVSETIVAVRGEAGSLSTLLSGALVTALRGAGEAFFFARQAADTGRLALIAVEGAVTLTIEAVTSLQALLLAGLATALDAVAAGAEGVIRGLAPFAAFLSDDLGASLTRAADGIDGMRSGIQGVRDESLEFVAGAGQRTVQALGALGDEAVAVLDRMTDTAIQTEDFRSQVDALGTSLEDGTMRERTFARATRETTAATREATNALAERAAVQGPLLAQMMAATVAEEAARRDMLLALDKERAEGANQLLDLEREKIASLALAEQDALAARADAYGAYADRAGTALAAVASGQQDVADAARAGIGEVLEALATEAFARASLAAASGNVGGALALIAAGVAARGSAMLLGASGSGSGGGNVAPGVSSTSNTTNVTNRSVTIQAGVVSHDMVADVRRMVTEGDRRGMA